MRSLPTDIRPTSLCLELRRSLFTLGSENMVSYFLNKIYLETLDLSRAALTEPSRFRSWPLFIYGRESEPSRLFLRLAQ
jgi:hypothetical protein